MSELEENNQTTAFTARWHYPLETRIAAADLIEGGHGKKYIATALGISIYTARSWIRTYNSVGRKRFLRQDERKAYGAGTLAACVADFVDNGMPRADVMAKYGIRNEETLKYWARIYRKWGLGGLVRYKHRQVGPKRSMAPDVDPSPKVTDIDRKG